MDNLSNWIQNIFGVGHSFQYKLFITLIIFGVLNIVRRTFLFFLFKKEKDVKTRYNWKKGTSYLSYFLFLLIISPIWIVELHSVGTFVGLLTAGLAVALKDPISNFFAWAYIVLKNPFAMGDRIQIGNSEGDILDIGFFEFTMLEIKNWVGADQSTGRIIHVPNGLLFTQPIINYNQAMNYIWNELPIVITFESDWKKAKNILLDIEERELKPLVNIDDSEFDSAGRKYHVYYENLTPTVYTKIEKSGVLLTLRYLCNPKKRRDSEQKAVEEILNQFEKHADIQFAYPTTRFFNAREEGKMNLENQI